MGKYINVPNHQPVVNICLEIWCLPQKAPNTTDRLVGSPRTRAARLATAQFPGAAALVGHGMRICSSQVGHGASRHTKKGLRSPSEQAALSRRTKLKNAQETQTPTKAKGIGRSGSNIFKTETAHY